MSASPQTEQLHPGHEPAVDALDGMVVIPRMPQMVDVPGPESEGLPARVGLENEADTPEKSRPDWRELQAAGDAAYAAAREREEARGPDAKLDAETVDLYRQVTENYSRAVWWGPKDNNLVAENPRIDMRMARAFAKQAKAIGPGKFLEGSGSSYIDEKSNLQDLAVRAQQRGIMGLMKGRIAELETDSTVVQPIIAKAAIKAAIEAGTGEHMSVRGTGKEHEITPESLEARGTQGIMDFTKAFGEEPEEGLEFIEEMAENVETGIHELPLAS